jgi:hypothetical protein
MKITCDTRLLCDQNSLKPILHSFALEDKPDTEHKLHFFLDSTNYSKNKPEAQEASSGLFFGTEAGRLSVMLGTARSPLCFF